MKRILLLGICMALLALVGCAANNMSKQFNEQEYSEAEIAKFNYRYMIEVTAPGNVKTQVSCESYEIEKLPYTNRDLYRLFDKEGRQIAILQVGKNYRVLIDDMSLGSVNGAKLVPSEVK